MVSLNANHYWADVNGTHTARIIVFFVLCDRFFQVSFGLTIPHAARTTRCKPPRSVSSINAKSARDTTYQKKVVSRLIHLNTFLKVRGEVFDLAFNFRDQCCLLGGRP